MRRQSNERNRKWQTYFRYKHTTGKSIEQKPTDTRAMRSNGVLMVDDERRAIRCIFLLRRWFYNAKVAAVSVTVHLFVVQSKRRHTHTHTKTLVWTKLPAQDDESDDNDAANTKTMLCFLSFRRCRIVLSRFEEKRRFKATSAFKRVPTWQTEKSICFLLLFRNLIFTFSHCFQTSTKGENLWKGKWLR